MATTPNSIITPQGVNAAAGVTFTSADTTVAKTIFTAGANGSVLKGIAACSNDTATINLQIFVGTILIATVRLVTLVGTDGAANAVNLLNATAMPFLQIDANGNTTLELPAGALVKAAPLATMTAAKTLWVYPIGEDY